MSVTFPHPAGMPISPVPSEERPRRLRKKSRPPNVGAPRSTSDTRDDSKRTSISREPSIISKAFHRALHRHDRGASQASPTLTAMLGPTNHILKAYVSHQVKSHEEQPKDPALHGLQIAKQKFATVGTIWPPAQAALSSINFTNSAINQPDLALVNSTLIQPLSIFNKVVEGISKIHPYAQVALIGLAAASKLILDQMDRDAKVQQLLSKISETYQFIMEDDILTRIEVMKGVLVQIVQVVQEAAQFIAKYSEATGFWERLGKNMLDNASSKITQYNDALDKLMQDFRNRELRDIHITVHQMREDLNVDGIAYAKGVGLNTSKKCLEGTRTEILSEIIDWIDDINPDAPRVFWLHGQAGKGKSSIAHTIALHAQNLRLLGSCFCFSRLRQSERLHEKLFTTVARDLADRDIRLKPILAAAVADHHSLKTTSDILQQWKMFIAEPLAKLSGPITGNVVIVIDALDESGDYSIRQVILQVLAENTAELPQSFRILVVSRPEHDIHEAFGNPNEHPHIRNISLDAISAASAEHDVRLYLADKLRSLKCPFSEEDVARLAQKSDGLFEWARLACEHVKPRKAGVQAKERLDELVSHAPGEGVPLLDEMYQYILRDVVDTSTKSLDRFQSVMRQIICTLDPLPMDSLNAIRKCFPDEVDP
ncbi:hypothetical protein ID866_9247, partial [Astraeus odoratus]